MPTNLLRIAWPDLSRCRLKKIRLALLFSLSPLFFFGQTLTGLWIGALSNDSNTIRKDQSFEIALTEYKGKVYGYSRSEFIVDDTLYFVVKRVKGTIDGDICEVTDDEIIAYNFRGKLDKGIKVTSVFKRNQSDSAWYLDGTWKTNATKKYYAVTGKVNLEEEKDLTASKIFPHLEELKLADEVAFYKDRKEGAPIVKIVKPEKIKLASYTRPESLTINSNVSVNPARPNLDRADATFVVEEPIIGVKKATNDLPKTETQAINSTTVSINPAAPAKTQAINNIPVEELVAVKKPAADLSTTGTKEIPSTSIEVNPLFKDKTMAVNKVPEEKVKTVQQPTADVSKTPVKNSNTNPTVAPAVKPVAVNKIPQAQKNPVNTQSQTIAATKPVVDTKTPVVTTPTAVNQNSIVATEPKQNPPVSVIAPPRREEKPIAEITAKFETVAGRKSAFTQVVSFKADSLELSLYDNGQIDGDTVSIFLDGEVIMSKQGLKATAIKKKIYIKPGIEDFTLVLFAENLGSYPPNTGLLVVRDGEDVYNLRFSSDFQKNAGIVFRRNR